MMKNKNIEILNQYICDSGFKLGYIAQQLGITYAALYNKMKGKHHFTVQELTILRNLLQLNDEQWDSLFF